MKYLKIEPGMNEILKNRLNEILNFSENMNFHAVYTYLLRMRGYQFCPPQRPLGGQQIGLYKFIECDKITEQVNHVLQEEQVALWASLIRAICRNVVMKVSHNEYKSIFSKRKVN